jgi:hypothetical protein
LIVLVPLVHNGLIEREQKPIIGPIRECELSSQRPHDAVGRQGAAKGLVLIEILESDASACHESQWW